MSKENQNNESQECWRDEYHKWICGFSNAQGGRLKLQRGGPDKGGQWEVIEEAGDQLEERKK